MTTLPMLPLFSSWVMMFMMSMSSITSMIPWTIIFLLTPFFGIRLYTIHNNEDCKRIQKKVNHCCTHVTEDNKGYGYSIGYWYILSITVERYAYGHEYFVWFVGTTDSFKRLMKKESVVVEKKVIEDEKLEKDALTVDVYERTGSYQNMYFYKRELVLDILPRPRESQQQIMTKIQSVYDETKRAVVFVYGPSGSGKSMLGLLLAKKCAAKYCNTLKPWQPGDQLCDLYNEVEPTEDHPLIVVFDEIDETLCMIHSGLPIHAKIPISVSNKMGWNRMLDEIDWGLYPYLIVLMTSNRSPEFIHKLDPSYLRPGRIHLSFLLTQN